MGAPGNTFPSDEHRAMRGAFAGPPSPFCPALNENEVTAACDHSEATVKQAKVPLNQPRDLPNLLLKK